MKFRPSHILILFLLISNACVFAKSSTTMSQEMATSIFANGNAAYRAQKYDEASAAYLQLLNAGLDTPQVLYNMGTASARLGKKGEALGYLTRAHSLAPRDENISANLAKVSQAPESTPPSSVAGTTFDSVWNQIVTYFTVSEWLAMVWVAMLFICIGIALLLTVKLKQLRRVARGLIWAGGGFLLLIIAPATARFYNTKIVGRSIAVEPTAVLSGPGERFTSVAALTEGQIVRNLQHETEGFQKVRLENGLQGYVRHESLMKL